MSECHNCEDLERINFGLIEQIRQWKNELEKISNSIDQLKMEMNLK